MAEVSKLFGLFGDPVDHSLSPLMHNTAFDHFNMDAYYLPFLIKSDKLAEAVAAIKALNMIGVNVTVPHKRSIASLLDKLEGDAALTGSVNTIHNLEGRLIGYSTDGRGLLRSLKEEAGWSPEGGSVIILGAGGAASAVAFRMAQQGISRMLILARDETKSVQLASSIRSKIGFCPETGLLDGLKPKNVDEFSLIINTTPVGMASHDPERMPPFRPEWIAENGTCCDLIYNPLETVWLSEARRQGRKTVSGLGMLIYQGAESFRIWTGLEMPVEKIRQILIQKLVKKV